MNTRPLDKFARSARRQLHEQVAARLERVLRTDSAELREHAPALQKLKDEIKATSQAAVVERVAYTWFNRFCALRFMDVNHYTRIGIVSPVDGQFQPEILAEAKMGHVDEELVPDKRRRQILDLLGGSAPSRDPQGEAYRLLVVAACNSYHRAMPYLFESIADYTELLMPDDLLSGNSILAYTREALTPDACQDVEVIGWLYQFYIAEKKDEVFAALKQGSKISEQDIPSVTQLFTPDWIVRFLVDNSLGRLWMLSRPQSRLIERMSYYIRPDQTQAEYLRVASPEDLRVGDSAVGAAHMLTYAFDLLYAIYEEEGYNPPDIPRLILTQNLFGMEIDERAGALAAFALTMKACAKDRRFLKRGVRPNICVLHSIFLTETELASAPWRQQMAKNLIDLPMLDALTADLHKMEQAGLVGSLLRPQLTLQQIADVRARIGAADTLFAHGLNERVLDALDQLEFLARHHHVVVANPPYMGGKGMNAELSDFAQSEYPDSKADMFAMFIERNLELAKQGGLVAMITMQSWMFLSSYEKLRAKLLDQQTLLTMAHLGAKAFDSIGGEVVSTTAFVVERVHRPEYKGSYVRLVDGNSEAEKEAALRTALASPLHRASAADFKKIPGAPIAYWVSERIFAIFRDEQSLGNKTLARQGLATGDNDLFARLWHEVPLIDICFHAKSCEETFNLAAKWFPYNKGGEFRKWFGNILYVVDWQNDGQRIRNFRDGNGKLRSRPQNTRCYFREGITWSDVTSGELSCRYLPSGNIYDISGHSAFPVGDHDLYGILAYLNTRFCMRLAKVLNPTLHFQIGDYSNLPYPSRFISECVAIAAKRNVEIGKLDWHSYETSWDFTTLPLLRPEHRGATLATSYASLRGHWQAMTLEMQRLEQENNRIFIDAYGLQDELTPDVPLHEITLTCNPHYRYGAGKSDAEYEAMLLADTMAEFVSYAVGCMFGRYSLDKPGLILANAGETVEDYVRKVARDEDLRLKPQSDTGNVLKHVYDADDADAPNLLQQVSDSSNRFQPVGVPVDGPVGASTITFMPDRDNVLPILDGEWFEDDIVDRFKRFLRVTFGEAHYTENLAFVERALGRDLRSYFLREFYDDHLKRYQKRPIYWLFSSPKGSFNALIYMHRYRPDTVSVVLNEYLRDLRSKLVSHKRHLEQVSISASATPRDRTAALKEIDKLEKSIAELTPYENEVLYPLATQQVAIDLDDGVKVNYNRLGKALRKIVGVSG